MENQPHRPANPKSGDQKTLSWRTLAWPGGILLAIAAGFFAFQRVQTPAPEITPNDPTAAALDPPTAASADAERERGFPDSSPNSRQESLEVAPHATAARFATPPAAVPTPLPLASPHAQQLIQRLHQIDPNQGRLTPEQGTELKKGFADLVGQGTAAIPAIRQLLEQNQDFNFEDPEDANAVGYPSLRAGLLDALKQIGGPEATTAFLGTLRTTGDPGEIAWIAAHLEEQAPGQYRQEVVAAARETLNHAARGQLQVREAGPLFQVLQNYGDANVIADLDKAMPQWHYYATMAMAGLPEGQGVSALVQRVQQTGNPGTAPNTFALQMLAQMASQHPAAASALVEQARLDQIPERAWTKIVEGLAGDQYQFGNPAGPEANSGTPPAGLKTYHIESGNQNFHSLPFNLYGTAEEAAQRRAVVDQLLATTRNPAAVQALQNARAVLSAPAP